MTQLLNLFILMDEGSYKNLYIEYYDSYSIWLLERLYLFSKHFYFKCIKNRPYELIINKEMIKLKEIIIIKYFINYYQILGDEESN